VTEIQKNVKNVFYIYGSTVWTVSGQVIARVVVTHCNCGLQRQTVNHIVDTCPLGLTKFEGGLNLLHEAGDDAVVWLESTATAALAK